MEAVNAELTPTVPTILRFISDYQVVYRLNYWEVSSEIEYYDLSDFDPYTTTLPSGLILWPSNPNLGIKYIGEPTRFTATHNSQVARSKIDTGRTFARPRGTARTDTGDILFQLTLTQFLCFVYTYQTYLNCGIKWFWIRLPVGANYVLPANVPTRFISDFTANYVPGVNNFDVSASIEYRLPDNLVELVDRVASQGVGSQT